ncbi:Uncharacterised protein [Mycobacteroides abscessus subsp. massiliense]|nr:Uncharacterised protein [Mycobacteroides abscessus subsp. massiliense]
MHQRLDLLAFDLYDSDFANGIRATDHRLASERALPKKGTFVESADRYLRAIRTDRGETYAARDDEQHVVRHLA